METCKSCGDLISETELFCPTCNYLPGDSRYGGNLSETVKHIEEGEYHLAVNYLSKELEIKPVNINLLQARMKINFELGRHEDTIEDATKILEVIPNRRNALLYRAKSYIQIGQHDNAIRDTHLILEMDPRDSGAFTLASLCYLLLNNNNQAIYNASQALTEGLDNPTALYARAEAYFRNEEYESSQNDLDELLHRYPDNKDGNLLQAKLYLEFKQTDKIIYHATKVLKESPREKKALELRAFAYWVKGEYVKVHDDASLLLALDPDSKTAKKLLNIIPPQV